MSEINPLPVPSLEQKKIINSFKQNKNIVTRAIAGAGKTSTARMCAQSDPSKHSLMFTFSKPLQTAAKSEIIASGLTNLEIYTYHGAAGIAFGCTIQNDLKFIEALTATAGAPPINIKGLKCDALFLDECQDMSIISYMLIEMMTTAYPEIQIVILGDERQAINEYIQSRVEFLTECETIPGFQTFYSLLEQIENVENVENKVVRRPREWVKHTLSTSYRLTPAMANFVNRHILKKDLIRGGNKSAPNILPRYISVSFPEMATEIGRVVREAISIYGYEKVAILVPSVKKIKLSNCDHPLAIAVREHLTDIPVYIPEDGQILTNEMVKGKLTISTWSSFKGLERDCICLLNLDESYFIYNDINWRGPEVPACMYVATTRAKKCLIIIATTNKTLRTINSKTLVKDAKCTGKIKTTPYQEEKEKNKKIKNVKTTKSFTVHQLFRFMNAGIMVQLNKCVKVVAERQGQAPKMGKVSLIIPFQNQLKRYSEPVSFLYALVIPALVELVKNNSTTFAQNVTVPKIVDDLRDIQPYSYNITRQAYESFPSFFWDTVSKASMIVPKKRQPRHWFQLAVAEAVYNQNAHHTARQIINYDWIDNDFLEDASVCLDAAIEKCNGKFNVKFEKTFSTVTDSYKIRDVVDFEEFSRIDPVETAVSPSSTSDPKSSCTTTSSSTITSVLMPVNGRVSENGIWKFVCLKDYSTDHLLQLACRMALLNKKRGFLYLMLSGKTVEITLEDPELFLNIIFTKFDRKKIGGLLEDIQNFKNEYINKI